MEKIFSHASCLIRCRECYIGFPVQFSHFPEGMPPETVRILAEFAEKAMLQPVEISQKSGGLRRVVITESSYLVLGIVGYLQSFLDDPEGTYRGFCDKNGRPSYGFAAFVWDASQLSQPLPRTFPTLRSFQPLMVEQILPHWFKSENAIEADEFNAGKPVPYRWEAQSDPAAAETRPLPALNGTAPDQIRIFPLESGEALLNQAVSIAVETAQTNAIQTNGTQKVFSFCTDLCADLLMEDVRDLPFMNASASGSFPPEGELVPNRRVRKKPEPVSTVQKPPAADTEASQDKIRRPFGRRLLADTELEVYVEELGVKERLAEIRIANRYWMMVKEIASQLCEESGREGALTYSKSERTRSKVKNLIYGSKFFPITIELFNISFDELEVILNQVAEEIEIAEWEERRNKIEIKWEYEEIKPSETAAELELLEEPQEPDAYEKLMSSLGKPSARQLDMGQFAKKTPKSTAPKKPGSKPNSDPFKMDF